MFIQFGVIPMLIAVFLWDSAITDCGYFAKVMWIQLVLFLLLSEMTR